MDLKARLHRQALDEGFVAMGVCDPRALPDLRSALDGFVGSGWHGQMGWMEERMGWRGDPAQLWPEARSIIMLAESYAPQSDPRAVLEQPDRGAISVYARGRDYHDVVKKRLKRVGRWLLEQAPDEQIKVFVDTAPVMEKPLAQAAGLGWQGKHTNLLSRDFGNWVFLGAIFTTLELAPDPGGEDHCGSCRACLDVCPTDAFEGPHRLDARKCISYLTIEHDGPVDPALRPALGNRIYGCDDCLAVCPWNKFAQEARDARLLERDVLSAPKLAELAGLDDAGFRALFTASPVKRIGRARFLRNVCYAIGNSGDPTLIPAVEPLTRDPDAALAEAAQWALGRLNAAP
ncbi:MAG: tRNA epoxyqueuosine(34) reductase QueG [Rhodobacterales bacterium]|nr:MAG: tRNA epoxyqueuosine(34) reductase QueG [Rhodobacterales bacterium]